ncbi:ankyrin repeat and SAM domain-containing protein 6-like isoform X1 [Uloborus diversus]|uniref:ankyrin repeat and SAM domain-containing protein 6-like isoform X1 n=1 Tax=Uloborus diversus TaxID=327109 RepID=UPI0024090CDC|nr:ankyrin repeat and SAM domain-containing protein 6-like isoform X1 [Uloborus diversus]
MGFLEELLNACRNGDESRIIDLLQKGISINAQNGEGETPLQIASANGCIDVVRLLLNQGAFVDLPNYYGWTPLMHATLHGHSDIVVLLLDYKAKVNTFNKLGLAATDIAAWNGDLPILKLLIKAGAVVDGASTSRSNECDFSPLMSAAIRGQSEMFKFLLERGCAINYTSPITELTPLMLAVCNGHQHLVKMIIEQGGNINKVNMRGQSALDMAIECNQSEIEAYLYTVSFKNSGSSASNDILEAVRNGDVLKVSSIVQQNPAAVNICDGFGTTSLMLAATLGRNDIIEILIDSGTDLDVQDMNNGWTALMYAVFHRNAETVKMLIEKGARVDVFAYTGYNALDLATYIGSSDSDVFQILHRSCEVDDSIQRFSDSSPLDESDQEFLSPEENQISVSDPRSPSPSPSKEWSANISQDLQLMMPISSSKSLANSPIASSGESDDDSEEEFSDLNSSDEEDEKPASSVFKLLPPDKYLASILQDHKVETIRPNFLSRHIKDVNAIPSRKESCDSINKPPVNSLRTPHLVKLLMKRRWMHFGATNTLPLDDSLLEFDDSTSQQEGLEYGSTFNLDDSALKTDDSALKPDDSTLKFDDLTLKLNDLTLKLEDDTLGNSNSNSKSSDATLKSISNPQALSNSNSFEPDNNTILFERDREKVPASEIEKEEDAENAGDLTILLNKESLQEYVQKFRDQEIDLESFLCLTEDDFKNIGIEAHDSRQKFLDIISKMRNT